MEMAPAMVKRLHTGLRRLPVEDLGTIDKFFQNFLMFPQFLPQHFYEGAFLSPLAALIGVAGGLGEAAGGKNRR